MNTRSRNRLRHNEILAPDTRFANRRWWHVGKPPDKVEMNQYRPTTDSKTNNTNQTEEKTMNTKLKLPRLTGLIVTATLFALCALPSSAFAFTAAQTVISNIANVSWSGGPAGGVDSNQVDVTVQLVASIPDVAFVSSSPDPVAQGGTATVTYTLTSTANGLDNYTLASSSTTNSGVSAPGSVTANGTPLAVGASMILGVVDATTITVSGISTNNGLATGDTVIIGGTPFTITVTDDAVSNTSQLALSGAHGASVGTPVYEQETFTVTVVAGSLLVPTVAGSHTLTTTATSAAGTGSDATGLVNVAPATLTLVKSVDDTTPLPGQTITYTLVVENTSATIDATSVVIVDPIPTYTTYVAGSVTATGGGVIDYSNDGGSTWGAGDTAAATAISVTYATLASGNTQQTVTFQVQVDL